MSPDRMLERFRQHMMDMAEPYLWSDQEITEYFTDAQEDFVRSYGGIHDDRSSITKIVLHPGVADYPRSDRILTVKGAKRSDGHYLERVNTRERDGGGSKCVGRVVTLLLAQNENSFRVYPVPDEQEDGVVIRLEVDRLPLHSSCDSFDLEVAAHHTPYLLYGAYAKALLKNDAETYNPARSEQYQQRFERYCAQVVRERGRANHTRNQVRYGGL